MNEPDAKKRWNRPVKFTYGTTATLVALLVCMVTIATTFAVVTFQHVTDIEGQNSCRAQFAEAERRATLDVVTGLGDTFVIAVQNREQVATYIAAYQDRVKAANQLLTIDVEKRCS